MLLGMSPFSKIFQKHINQIIEDLDGVKTVSDDILTIGYCDSKKPSMFKNDPSSEAMQRMSGVWLNKESWPCKSWSNTEDGSYTAVAEDWGVKNIENHQLI